MSFIRRMSMKKTRKKAWEILVLSHDRSDNCAPVTPASTTCRSSVPAKVNLFVHVLSFNTDLSSLNGFFYCSCQFYLRCVTGCQCDAFLFPQTNPGQFFEVPSGYRRRKPGLTSLNDQIPLMHNSHATTSLGRRKIISAQLQPYPHKFTAVIIIVIK